MGKKLTIQDATKPELIEYFFNGARFGAGEADKDRFLLWLEEKRSGALIDAQKNALDVLQKALQEYIELVNKANEVTDIEKKLEYFEKANKAYERYEDANNKYDSFGKKYVRMNLRGLF